MAIQIHVRPLVRSDLEPLLKMLAENSAIEAFEAGAKSAIHLWRLIQGHEAYVGLINGKLVCAYGWHNTTIAGNQINIWMLVTKSAMEHPFVFVRHTRTVLDKLRARDALVRCFINTKFDNHHRWVKLLGFKLSGMMWTDEAKFCEYRLRAN